MVNKGKGMISGPYTTQAEIGNALGVSARRIRQLVVEGKVGRDDNKSWIIIDGELLDIARARMEDRADVIIDNYDNGQGGNDDNTTVNTDDKESGSGNGRKSSGSGNASESGNNSGGSASALQQVNNEMMSEFKNLMASKIELNKQVATLETKIEIETKTFTDKIKSYRAGAIVSGVLAVGFLIWGIVLMNEKAAVQHTLGKQEVMIKEGGRRLDEALANTKKLKSDLFEVKDNLGLEKMRAEGLTEDIAGKDIKIFELEKKIEEMEKKVLEDVKGDDTKNKGEDIDSLLNSVKRDRG